MGNWGSVRLSHARHPCKWAEANTGHGLKSLRWKAHSPFPASCCLCGDVGRMLEGLRRGGSQEKTKAARFDGIGGRRAVRTAVVDMTCVRRKYESKGLITGGEQEDLADRGFQRRYLGCKGHELGRFLR